MDREPLPARKGFKIATVTDNMKKKIFSKAGFENYVNLIKTCKYMYSLGTDTLTPERFDMGKWILAVAPTEYGVTCIHIVQRETIYHNNPKSFRLSEIQSSFKHVHFGTLEIPVMAGADVFYMGDCLNVEDNSLTDILTSLGDNGSTVARMIIPLIEWQSLALADYWTNRLKMSDLVLTAIDSAAKFASLYHFLYNSSHINWVQLELSSHLRQWQSEIVRIYDFCYRIGPVEGKVLAVRMISDEIPCLIRGHMELMAEKVGNYGCSCKRLMLARFAREEIPLFIILLCIKSEVYICYLYANDPQAIFTAIQKVLTDRRYTDALFTPTYFCPHSDKIDRMHPKMFPEHDTLLEFIRGFS